MFNTRNRTGLQNRDASPAVAFNDAINRIMTQDALRSRPVTAETLDHTNLDESLAFYQDRFADASDFTFIFVGNIDLDTVRPLVERYLGGLPSINRVETWRDLGDRPPSGVIEETVRKGLEPQAQTRVFFTGSLDYGDRSQRLGIAAMTAVLRSRLREVLREELGGTYSVTVGSTFSWRPEGQYRLSITFGSDPERADELLDAVYGEIERLKGSPPTEAEVNDVREAQRRTWETNQESNSWWLNVLDGRYRYLARPERRPLPVRRPSPRDAVNVRAGARCTDAGGHPRAGAPLFRPGQPRAGDAAPRGVELIVVFGGQGRPEYST